VVVVVVVVVQAMKASIENPSRLLRHTDVAEAARGVKEAEGGPHLSIMRRLHLLHQYLLLRQ
jgi:hypothetical protein